MKQPTSDSSARPEYVYLHWRSLATGKTGHGEAVEKHAALAWIEQQAAITPQLVYELRPALSPDEPRGKAMLQVGN